MGSGIAMLFAEHGLEVGVFDIKPQNIDNLLTSLTSPSGLNRALHARVHTFRDYAPFLEFLGGKNTSKLLVLSIPHGDPADKLLENVDAYLTSGDVILDGGNEWYQNARRRQDALRPRGIAYISMGVSGGYQAARRGPSISASGDKDALDAVLPLLEKFAAKDPKTGAPCVANLGPSSCGHYVKMAHNGIEQGILGIVSETWELLYKCMHFPLDDIATIWNNWVLEGELVGPRQVASCAP